MPFGNEAYSRSRGLLYLQQNLVGRFLRLDSSRCRVSAKPRSAVFLDNADIWISDVVLGRLGESLMDFRMDKKSMGWELPELEGIALSSADRSVDSDDESDDSG